MTPIQSELVWTGLTHLGDEPGIHSNAHYSGLSFELPLTIRSGTGGVQTVKLFLSTKLVKVFSGYPGHKVTITQFIPDSSTTNQYDYTEVVLAEDYILDSSVKEISFDLDGTHIFLSCKVEVDTKVSPGLYDDFLLKRIGFQSQNFKYYASFGFR